MRGRSIDLKGEVFGELTVVRESYRLGGHVYWLCRCSCGALIVRTTGRLRQGKRKGSNQTCFSCRQKLMEAGRDRKKIIIGENHGKLDLLCFTGTCSVCDDLSRFLDIADFERSGEPPRGNRQPGKSDAIEEAEKHPGAITEVSRRFRLPINHAPKTGSPLRKLGKSEFRKAVEKVKIEFSVEDAGPVGAPTVRQLEAMEKMRFLRRKMLDAWGTAHCSYHRKNSEALIKRSTRAAKTRLIMESVNYERLRILHAAPLAKVVFHPNEEVFTIKVLSQVHIASLDDVVWMTLDQMRERFSAESTTEPGEP